MFYPDASLKTLCSPTCEPFGTKKHMEKQSLRIARRFLRRLAEESGKEPTTEVTPERLMDLTTFFLGFASYAEHLENSDLPPDALLKKGMVDVRRYMPQMTEGLQKLIVQPLLDRPDAARFKPHFRLLEMGGNLRRKVLLQANLMAEVLPWMKTRAELLRGQFPGKAARRARDLAAIASETEIPSRLNKIAELHPISGLRKPKKWLFAAAAAAGAPLTSTEKTMVDANEGKELGEELARVTDSIRHMDAGTQEAADLQERRSAVLEHIEDAAYAAENSDVVLSSAAVAAASPPKPATDYATETAKRLGNTPDQEAAMMVRGRSIIAAGAGSGKTRVVASKVAYHINELGFPATSVMATSFTRKASAQLIKTIEKYGAVIPRAGRGNFGTTHSIAGGILDRAETFKRSHYIGRKEGWKQTTIMQLALRQIEMKGGGEIPPPKGFFDGVFTEVQDNSAEYQAAIDQAIGYYEWAAKTWNKPWQGRPGRPEAAEWAGRQVAPLKRVRKLDPRALTDKQKDYLNKLLKGVKGRNPVQFRVGAEDAPEKKKKRKQPKIDDYTFSTRPAGEWFNLGIPLADEDEGYPPIGDFKRAVSILKGSGFSPLVAWHGLHNPDESGLTPNQLEVIQRFGKEQIAVYAAYEWLKGNKGEPDFINTGDMDDLLIDCTKALLGSPRLRKGIQNQFKVVMVDEAQDLNAIQHLMFGLVAGYVDGATLKPNEDKSMTADTYTFVGDDKQCVDVDAPVLTPDGLRKAGDLRVGDKVISNRNGCLVPQTINHVMPSRWTQGLKVTTELGHNLIMSPNHRLWATSPETEDGQMVVYLMYRKDMGFRVGITNKGKVGSEGDFGGRAFLEKAERLWVLDICESREQALLEEYRISLRYSIPTMVFNGEHRGIDQTRINTIFKEFGGNGARLLEERHLSVDYPHWMSQSYSKHGRERHTINLIAHSGSNTQVAMEWTGDKFDEALDGLGVRTKDDRRRLRRWFASYRDALQCASLVSEKTGAQVSHRLATPDGPVREIPASGLFVGMSIPVHNGPNGCIELDPIVSIEEVPGQFVDLDVDDASNFFAGGILTHNSIYEFRGADPDEFISKSDLTDEGDDFDTKLLTLNFRSGAEIVAAANRLISHNKRQIPMVCDANVDVKGNGSIIVRETVDEADAASTVAEEIEGMIAAGDAENYSDFGIALRSNREAYEYGLEMLKRGIPFKANVNFFNDTNTKALIGWLTIAEQGLDGGDPEILNKAMTDALKAPKSKMGKAFIGKLEATVPTGTAWPTWLTADQRNISKIYANSGRAAKWHGHLQELAANLKRVSQMIGEASAILESVMDLVGVDQASMVDSMVDQIRNNDDLMAQLTAESETGSVSEEQILEQALGPVSPLIGLLRSRNDLPGSMTYVRKLQNVNSKVSSRDTEKEIDRDAVTIGTMHSWKGLEIPNMYVPMVGSKFPRAGEKGTAKEDHNLWSERRLAYVAVTRAEDRCVILDIPHPKFKTRSQFIKELCAPLENPGELIPKDGPADSNPTWTDPGGADYSIMASEDPVEADKILALVEAGLVPDRGQWVN